MSRSGWYECEFDSQEAILAYGRGRGQVASAVRGKRGQKLLKDLYEALEALPKKVLVKDELITSQGEVCAIGAVLLHRGFDPSKFDIDDYEEIAKALNIAPCLVQEIEFNNDNNADYVKVDGEWVIDKVGTGRYDSMKSWVLSSMRGYKDLIDEST